MENQELVPLSDSGITVARDPKIVLEEAKKAAQALMTVVAQKKKPVIINNEQYLEFEDWMTVARFYAITVRVSKTELIDLGGVKGYEATAVAIRNSDGMVISSADAMCLNDEEKWSTRPKYEYVNGVKTKTGEIAVPLFQLRSMAQTRACAKALRNILSWVVVLAGFKPTPAEEMTDGIAQPANIKPAVATPQSKTETSEKKADTAIPSKAHNPISLPQSKRLYAIYKSAGWTDEDVKSFLTANFGIEHIKDIEREFYDDIVNHFMKPKPKNEQSDDR